MQEDKRELASLVNRGQCQCRCRHWSGDLLKQNAECRQSTRYLCNSSYLEQRRLTYQPCLPVSLHLSARLRTDGRALGQGNDLKIEAGSASASVPKLLLEFTGRSKTIFASKLERSQPRLIALSEQENASGKLAVLQPIFSLIHGPITSTSLASSFFHYDETRTTTCGW